MKTIKITLSLLFCVALNARIFAQVDGRQNPHGSTSAGKVNVPQHTNGSTSAVPVNAPQNSDGSKGAVQPNGFQDPDVFLQGPEGAAQVLLVGSWHFAYPNMDAHKTASSDQIDILSDRKQKELMELLDYLARFKPTKIMVEGGRNSGYLMWRYRDWKSGEEPLGRSEIDQVAIRLLDRFGLDTLYGVDALPLMTELWRERDTTQPLDYLNQVAAGFGFGGEDEMSQRYSAFYDYKDRMTVEKTILENFHYMNADKTLDRGFGAYIAGGHFAQAPGMEGADALSTHWFNRNLRIYHNIRRQDIQPEDRVLVLFGAGHIPILKFLFQSSPEFELVKFRDLEAWAEE